MSTIRDSKTFQGKLDDCSKRNRSLLCVGLDPDPELMPVKDVFDFNSAIIEATADLVCCYKPNLAFYESLGLSGLDALQRTLEIIPDHIPVIGDAKRGDIGSTAKAYAKAMFEVWKFDAVTVSPYLGKDSIDPFLEYQDRGVFLLCRTSNAGASEFQDMVVDSGDRLPVYKHVASRAKEWNLLGNLGLVVGATYPEQLREVRVICGDMPILAPGVGAQGGNLEATVKNGINSKSGGIIINASRSVLYASSDKGGFAAAARLAAKGLRDQINEVID